LLYHDRGQHASLGNCAVICGFKTAGHRFGNKFMEKIRFDIFCMYKSLSIAQHNKLIHVQNGKQ